VIEGRAGNGVPPSRTVTRGKSTVKGSSSPSLAPETVDLTLELQRQLRQGHFKSLNTSPATRPIIFRRLPLNLNSHRAVHGPDLSWAHGPCPMGPGGM